MTQILDVLENQEIKPEWDPNHMESKIIKDIGENVQIQYFKSKKVAMVSSRDGYIVICSKELQPEETESGNKIIKIGVKSLNSDKYPEIKGVVRAQTIISGYYLEELKPDLCRLDFMVESDVKIKLFISKQVAPKSCNYAYYISQYLMKQNSGTK